MEIQIGMATPLWLSLTLKAKAKGKGENKGKKGDGKGKGNADQATANGNPVNKSKAKGTYIAKGLCKDGDNCVYAHGNKPGKPPKTTTPPVPKDATKNDKKQETKATEPGNAAKHFTKQSAYYAMGQCSFGDKCTFLHIKKAVTAHVDLRQVAAVTRPNNVDMPGATQHGSIPG